MSYLKLRWSQGCHNATELYGELIERGYDGSYTPLKDLVRPWRSTQFTESVVGPTALRWLVLRSYDNLDSSEQQQLNLALNDNPLLAHGHHLKEAFRRMTAQRDAEYLEDWISEASQSGLKPFQSLARGFLNDFDAIRNAILLPWSTAQCEGQICRVKLIKRQGYGRAKLDLLRQRILHRSATA